MTAPTQPLPLPARPKSAIPPPGMADHLTARVTLHDHSTLTLSTQLPATSARLEAAAMSGALYVIPGRVHRPDGLLGAYVGEAGNADGHRAASSYRRFVRITGRLHPLGLALLHPADAASPYWHTPFRKYVEARVLRSLSAADLWLLNTHTNAGRHSERLSRPEILHGQHDATVIAGAVRYYLLQGQSNAHPSPVSNLREAAVRAILHADRALDTAEIVRLLRATGYRSVTLTPWASVRRDLQVRERELAGSPRVYSALHHGVVVYWTPRLKKRDALRGWDLAHRYG